VFPGTLIIQAKDSAQCCALSPYLTGIGSIPPLTTLSKGSATVLTVDKAIALPNSI